MGCTVAELEQRVSHAEYLEWMQYYAIEPFGLHAQDRLFAQLSGAVLAAGGVKNVNLSDLLQFDEDRLTLPDDVEAEEQRMMLMLMKRAG